MCGINGIFAFHPAAPEPAEAEALLTRDAMMSRGPDGAGLWWSAGRRCVLGHRRLAIIDLSARAAQPMTSADGRLAISFNGEIYNFRALRAELERSGAVFRTDSDTEVLLALYARDGEAMVGRLRGMFAFALWDETRQGMLLARDPYGIKPLYLADDGKVLRFASQVTALIKGGAISRERDPAGMAGFYLWGSVPEPFTLYRHVRALAAGHTQWFGAGGAQAPKPYVNFAAVLAQGAGALLEQGQIAATVAAAVKDSVAAHLVADVETGVFLSAGVDSGALLGLMRDAGAEQPPAITLTFEEFRGTAEDEAPLAAEVASAYGARHLPRLVGQKEFDEDLPRIFAAMDQPSMDGINSWFVAKAAKEAGLKVMLSGLGGDEVLAGYSSFADVPRWHRRFGPAARLPGLGRLSRRLLGALPGLTRKSPKAAAMLEYAGSWAGAYLLKRGLFLPHELPDLMGREAAAEGLRRLAPLASLSRSLAPDPGSDNGRVCALESAHYLRNQLLRDADWAGMAHSVEIRTPLVDVRLFGALAPVIGALSPGQGKAALAAAPSRALPRAVVARAKTGFGVPTGAWMAGRAPAHEPKGLVSRRWSRQVLDALLAPGMA